MKNFSILVGLCVAGGITWDMGLQGTSAAFYSGAMLWFFCLLAATDPCKKEGKDD